MSAGEIVQRGVCRWCEMVVSRRPGGAWSSSRTGANCFESPRATTAEPGLHQPLRVIGKGKS